MTTFLKNKLLIRFLISIIIILFIINIYAFHLLHQSGVPLNDKKLECVDDSSDKLRIIRFHDTELKLTQPLMLVDQPLESDAFADLKSKIENLINEKISEGNVQKAAVYLRSLNDGRWTAINATEVFNPASMLKISIMICFLKQAEANPELLKQKVYVKSVNMNLRDKRNEGNYLEPHRYYTYEDLLQKMIAGSDNESANILVEKISLEQFKELYHILNIPANNIDDINYVMNVVDMSKFLRLLYNATYLNTEWSEYALNMLTHTTFNDGINRKFKDDIIVAHKFGERILSESCQVHDSGIIYIKGFPVLLTVMTLGSNQANLEELLSEIGLTVKTEIETNLNYYRS